MINHTTIICFGEDISHSVLSKYQIMKRLACANQVYYIESIGQRAPSISGRDMYRIFNKLRRLIQRHPVSDNSPSITTNFHIIRPMVLPFHHFQIIQTFNFWMLKHQLQSGLRYVKNTPTPLIVWVGLPTVPPHILGWHPDVVVYHCADKLVANVSGKQRKLLDRMHDFWLEKADLVFTPSEIFLKELQKKTKKALLLPHGVDFAHFSQTNEITNLPADINKFQGPLIGYIGTISSEWVDARLLGQVAQLCPDMTFVLIGPAHHDMLDHPHLQKDNIHFLGPRPYQTIPAYLSAFSVCIIPKVRSEMTNASMPLKLREYLAAGKPVVSTLPVPAKFGNLVNVVKDAENFALALRNCVQVDSPELSTTRQMAVRNDSWEAVTEILSQLIESCMRERGS